jgi:hypothetical protein
LKAGGHVVQDEVQVFSLSEGQKIKRLNFHPITLFNSDHWRLAVPTLAVPVPFSPVSLSLRAVMVAPGTKEEFAKGLG